jgi:uncharacterized alkaline shock family protein YloU
MASESPNYTTELGRVYIGWPIIRRAIEPELTFEAKFEPASSPKSCIDLDYVDGKVGIAVKLAVGYKVNIENEAPKLQQRIKRSVEAITGLSAGDIVLHIERVFQPKDKQGKSKAGTSSEPAS